MSRSVLHVVQLAKRSLVQATTLTVVESTGVFTSVLHLVKIFRKQP